MNRLKWYSLNIWNSSKYESLKSLHSDLFKYLTGNNSEDLGHYFSVVQRILRDNGKMEIPFMRFNSRPYTIDTTLLLTGRRHSVFDIEGIHVYVAICRLLRFLNKKGTSLTAGMIIKKARSIYFSLFSNNSQISDIYQILTTILHNPISNKTSEQSLWDDIIALYFGFLNSQPLSNNNIVQLFEDALLKLKKDVIKDVAKLIDYENKLGNKSLRHKILTDLGIKVCPYCNRNYITWYQSQDNKTLTTADLDHYYQKGYYPLFALSLFNFVPSCQVCNSRLKGTNPMEEALYPFEEGFDDDASFNFQLLNSDPQDPNYAKSLLHSWLGMKPADKPEFTIKIKIKDGISQEKREKITGSKKLFRLEEIYSTHFDKALDISLIARCYDNPDYKHYCDTVLKSLHNQLMINSLSIFETYYNYDWIVFGYHWNVEKGVLNFDAPLSRMTWDIFQQYRNHKLP